MKKSLTEDMVSSESNQTFEITALHLAASMGFARVASMILQECPDIDAVDASGKTALEVAIEKGFEKAVEFLVNSGAQVDLNEPRGRAILLLVVEKGWHSVGKLITNSAGSDQLESTPLRSFLVAAYDGNDVAVKQILSSGLLGVEQNDRDLGAYAFFIALERSQINVARSLLAAGVDLNSKDHTGQTALHRATRKQDVGVMRFLIEAGISIDAENDDGRTAWSANLRNASEATLLILLNAGASPNTRAHNGISELYSSAASGDVEFVKYMLKSGTNPSIQTNFRWAPLHWAASNGHLECVKLLVEAGADSSPISDQGSTPLDLALRQENTDIVQYLRKAGAKEAHEISADTKFTPSLPEESANPEISFESISSAIDSTANKLSMTFDQPLGESLSYGQFIYPNNNMFGHVGSDLIYEISHPIDSVVECLYIRRTTSRPTMAEYPIPAEHFNRSYTMYEIVPTTPNYQELEVRSSFRSPTQGIIKMNKTWTGSWKVVHENLNISRLLFQTIPDWSHPHNGGHRWTDSDKVLLARSYKIVGKEYTDPPQLSIEPFVDPDTRDVLITCWVAKLWMEHITLQVHAT